MPLQCESTDEARDLSSARTLAHVFPRYAAVRTEASSWVIGADPKILALSDRHDGTSRQGE
jgi:hypothetical protein